MVQWVKDGDIEKIEGFDKESGQKTITYQIKIATTSVVIPVGMEKDVMDNHIRQLDDEGRYTIEEWFEKFIFSRMEDKFDYEAIAEEEGIPPLRIICSDSKKKGSIIVIAHREDVINMVARAQYKQIIQSLNKRRKIDPEKIRIEFGD